LKKAFSKTLFVEKARLGAGCGCGGFLAGDADDSQHGQLCQRSAGHKDAVGIRIEVRRSDLQTVVM